MATKPTLATPTVPAPVAPPAPPAPPAAPTPPAPVAAPAKPKKQKTPKTPDQPAAQTAPTVQPPAPGQPDAPGSPQTLEAALKRISELENALAKGATLQHEAEGRLKAMEHWVSLPTEVRSQQVADATYDGPKSFFVQRADNPGLTLKASSDLEAIARYDSLCGIRHSERPASVSEVVGTHPTPTPAFGRKK